MEYVYKINIFGLKMMVKSGLEKIFFEIPPCAKPFSENQTERSIIICFIQKRYFDKMTTLFLFEVTPFFTQLYFA